MVKNKVIKRVLAFVSTFVILLSLCASVVFAQAPEISTNNNPNLYYYNVLVFDDLGLSQDDNVLAYFHLRVSATTYQLFSIDCVLTDYYYSEYYLEDYLVDLSGTYDISISSKRSGSAGGSGAYFNDSYILDSLNYFNYFYISGNDTPLLNSTILSNCITSAIDNQFVYWENQVDNAYNEGYDVGLDSGLLFGYDQGYESGLSEGKSLGYQSGYTQSLLDYDAFENGLFAIFQSPFVFVQNITTLDVFGISLIDVVTFVIVLCLGFVLIKFIGGALPL